MYLLFEPVHESPLLVAQITLINAGIAREARGRLNFGHMLPL